MRVGVVRNLSISWSVGKMYCIHEKLGISVTTECEHLQLGSAKKETIVGKNVDYYSLLYNRQL